MKIADVRTYTVEGGKGGDYHAQEEGHWIVDRLIANPMSRYPEYKHSRRTWGISALGSILVEVETDDGTVGYGTSLGGEAACFIIEAHFKRFLVGADPRDIARLWDQMYRASLPYGRKGLPIIALSAVDLALWDVLGKLRGEPVYHLIGGSAMDRIPVYATGVRPELYKEMGFHGAKIVLPHGPADGTEGLRENIRTFAEAREKVGPHFDLRVDCYMALDVPYSVRLAAALEKYGIDWLEESLHPDDHDGYRLIREAAPRVRLATGEHEYTRYGFRDLITSRAVDIIQPDLTWAGGLTEALRIAAMAAAYDISVIPHGSGAFSYHFVKAQVNSPLAEYVFMSPRADEIVPVFGSLFEGEPLPSNGYIELSDRPGFGLELRPDAPLRRYTPFRTEVPSDRALGK